MQSFAATVLVALAAAILFGRITFWVHRADLSTRARVSLALAGLAVLLGPVVAACFFLSWEVLAGGFLSWAYGTAVAIAQSRAVDEAIKESVARSPQAFQPHERQQN